VFVSQGLSYELQVYHPHSCLHALLAEVRARPGSSGSVVRQWSQQAELLVDKLMVRREAASQGVPAAICPDKHC
jgi:hypothetical protein